METLALHFRWHSDALDFPVITFVLGAAQSAGSVPLSTVLAEQEGAQGIAFSSSKTQQTHPQLPSFEGSGEPLHPHGGSLVFFHAHGLSTSGKSGGMAWLSLSLSADTDTPWHGH